MYKVRVAASGQKVAVYKNDKILKVIQASDETFKPAEAVKYAEELNIQLQKEAQQMVDPAGPITTPTKSEQQQIDMPKTLIPATGIGGPDIMSIQAKLAEAQKQIEALTIHNAQLQETSTIERKARRGLAIAKQEVFNNKLASTESNIEARVMEITAMSDEDISLLERKTAGLPEFETVQHAQKYASSMKIKSRIYRQAAEEAMEDGSEDEAVNQESKAAYCDERVKIAEQFVDDANQPEMAMEMGTNTPEEQVKEASDDNDEDDQEDAPEQVKEASDDNDEDDDQQTKEASEDDDEDDDDDYEDDEDEDSDFDGTDSSVAPDMIDQVDQQAEGKAPNMNYANQLGSLYKKVAKHHKLIAKMAAEDGDTEAAQEAQQEADDAEKKAAIFTNASANKSEIGSNLVDLYTKIANFLAKVADDAEKSGQEDVADEADEEAKTARRKANILFRAQNNVSASTDDDDEEEDSKTASAEEEAPESDDDEKDSDKEAAVSEENEDKEESKVAAISTHSEGVSKIASVEVNAMAHDPSIETLASQLWGKIEK